MTRSYNSRKGTPRARRPCSHECHFCFPALHKRRYWKRTEPRLARIDINDWLAYGPYDELHPEDP